ncbi:MAG: ABC transporter ATP-binding protein [Bacteroidales bacterium]|nr:ABC transporter ATP-binding protein [Bacteroidales bacterium]
MSDMTPIMELQQLSIGYAGGKKEPLFSNISAQISKGMLIALFGRNGIGKSTLLRTMARLQPPTGGTAILLGRELPKWTPAQVARQIAFVPSHPIRTPRLSVADMVGAGRYGFTNWMGAQQQSDREAIARALEATSLTPLAHRDSSTLSDGELQRASIARSLAQETPLIFLDEPTAFLDLGNKYKTVYLLKELTQTAQKGILFTTHDLTLALQVCDTIWHMADDGFHALSPAQFIQSQCHPEWHIVPRGASGAH